jgi:DNA helicase-2/ATP-dependent DNA helicase PcrA
VKNILEFPDCFGGADIIRLERNYRSTTPILRAAASVVDHNQGRLGKKLKSERGDGKAPVLAFLPDQDTETEFCAELIQKSVSAANLTYSEWAVVYRTNAQSLGFETEFLRRKIPYRVVGSLKFYEREEVKDTLALLSFLVNPRDEIAFRRVVNKPARGVGPASVDKIIDEALGPRAESEGRRGNLLLAAKGLAPELPAKARSGIAVFLKAIEAGREALSEAMDHEAADGKIEKVKNRKTSKAGLRSGEGLSECVVCLAVESGLAEHYIAEDEIAGNQRLSNLQEVANAASLYAATRDGLLEFLEHIELDRSMEEASNAGTDAVTLITLHNTKGLECRRVIMTGIEQGIFPRDDKKGDDLEEERRLFYVGATRAMDELYLTSCAYRRMYGRTESMEPSLFLREIDRKGLRIIGSVPSGFTAYQRGMAGIQGGKPGFPGGKPMVTSDGRWALGDRVFHDDHGYGQVTQIREGDDGPVVKVVFETGNELRFLSLHQSSRFTKIKDD